MTTVDTRTAGDELLRWVSEAGSGSWDRLRDASAYLSHKHQLNQRPWALASQLSSLGHLDIDWSTRKWSVASPTLNVVRGLGLCVVLTGSRPHYVDRRFDEATDDLDIYPFEVPQPPAPAAKYAKCASVEVADDVARRLGASLVIDPPRALLSALRPVDEMAMKPAPPPPLEEAQRFDPKTLGWQGERQKRASLYRFDLHGRAVPPRLDEQPGLYRVDLHGRAVHRRLDEYGYWWSIDLSAGQFLALRESATAVLRWRRPSRHGGPPGCLEVRQQLSLPILAERAATICSGLAPVEVDGWRRYLNVPHDTAERLAQRLLQKLEVI
jgi:hypothetical protein